jgi:hypothetical protein
LAQEKATKRAGEAAVIERLRRTLDERQHQAAAAAAERSSSTRGGMLLTSSALDAGDSLVVPAFVRQRMLWAQHGVLCERTAAAAAAAIATTRRQRDQLLQQGWQGHTRALRSPAAQSGCDAFFGQLGADLGPIAQRAEFAELLREPTSRRDAQDGERLAKDSRRHELLGQDRAGQAELLELTAALAPSGGAETGSVRSHAVARSWSERPEEQGQAPALEFDAEEDSDDSGPIAG